MARIQGGAHAAVYEGLTAPFQTSTGTWAPRECVALWPRSPTWRNSCWGEKQPGTRRCRRAALHVTVPRQSVRSNMTADRQDTEARVSACVDTATCSGYGGGREPSTLHCRGRASPRRAWSSHAQRNLGRVCVELSGLSSYILCVSVFFTIVL